MALVSRRSWHMHDDHRTSLRARPARLVAAALLALLPAASAAAQLDAVSSAASSCKTRQISWTHALGAGTNRVLVVGLTVADRPGKPAPPQVAADVRLAGVPLTPVPGGVAVSRGPGGVAWTQLFYLGHASLPAAGSYTVSITLPSPVDGIAGGATSFRGLAQSPPESVRAAVAAHASRVTTTLAVASPGAWIVDAVGADTHHDLEPAGTGQTVRYARQGHGVSGAGSADAVANPGPRSLTWALEHGKANLAHVAAAFAPALVPLTVATQGLGSVDPAGGSFIEGTTIPLRATPASGWVFAGWTGDLTGNANPAPLSMDGPKSVTARFTPDFRLYGWATAGSGTTGGEGGPEVVVDTLSALRFYAGQPGPYVIKVFGTIAGNEVVRVRSHKSILGIGTGARLLGVGLQVGWNSEFGQIGNVIIRNVAFEKALAPIDGVMVSAGAHHVWIDHCEFSSDRDHGVDFYDGLLDVNHGADFITVSWSRFHDHYKTSLVGNSDNTGDEDAGHLTVTYHHNSFIRSGGRNPSVRFGLVHVYNNLYRDLDDYGVAARMDAQVPIENNWFENVDRPIRADTSLSPVAGHVSGVDTNAFVNCTPNSITSTPATWVPPYGYFLDPVASVPETVAQYAGVGVVVFDGEAPPPTAPTIVTPPVSQTVEEGDNAGFSVVAEGTFPFTYQWHKDGAAIDGAAGSTLSLQNVQTSDAAAYTVLVANAAGSVTSDPAVLTVEEEPPPPPPSANALRERIADGERVTQALPDSAAWFTSSGSSNLVAAVGELKQMVSSSRTFLAYFTDATASPLTLAAGQTLTLDFAFRFTGFDSAAPASDATFRVGLLRSVANPLAISGAGFVANGPPNTNARVVGDFGSNNPGTNAFSLYSGYAAFTSVNAPGTAVPIRFYARTGSAANLLNSTSPFTQVPVGSPAPSAPMEAGVPYRGRLELRHTGATILLAYTVRRAADGVVVMSHSVEDAAAAMTEFDTVAFYMSKATASANYDFIVTEVDVIRTAP
jgi:pectate lyase